MKRSAAVLAGLLALGWATRDGSAAGPKSNGPVVVVDDQPGGSAGTVGATGGGRELDGGLGQTAAGVNDLTPGTTVEAGYFSRLVANPALAVFQNVYPTSMTFTWSNPAPANPSGALYRVDLSTASDFSGTVFSSASYGFSAGVAGLGVNTTYYARIQVGYLEGDDTVFFPLGADATLALPPDTAVSTFPFVGTSTITASWSANGNPLGITTYTVVFSTSSSYPNADAATVVFSTAPLGSLPTGTTTLLSPNTLYFLFVAAVNHGGVSTPFVALGSTKTLSVTDTIPPTITNNQAGDAAWRKANNGIYDVDFADAGGSNLSKFQVKASTMPGGVGPDLTLFTDVVTNISAPSFTANWSLPLPVFTALLERVTNYITIRVEDNAGNAATLTDAFYVKKDTTAPLLANNQAGDATVRSAGGTLYDVDAFDAASGLAAFQYSASTTPASGDASAIGWTDIPIAVGATFYATNWSVNFPALISGTTNYVSVRAWDIAGSTRPLTDAFFVLKDTGGPVVAITVPSSVYRSSLAAIQGTAADFSGVRGTEVSVQDAGSGFYWNGSGFTSLSQVFFPASGTNAWTYSPGIGWINATTYQVVARSSDTAGNYSAPYATATFTFDSSTPTAGVAVPPASSVVSALPTISGTASDPSPNSGLSSVDVQLRRDTDGLWWNWFTEAWQATPVSTQPTGAFASWSLTTTPLLRANLADQTSYYVAVRAADNAVPANVGDFFAAGSSTFTFSDTTPPAPVTDLAAASGVAPGTVKLDWTATGDDGLSGIILLGEFRIDYSTTAGFTPSTSAAQVAVATGTVSPGSARSYIVPSLIPGDTYYLYVFTRDDAGLWSTLSNGATAMATPAPINSITGHVMNVSSQGITAVLIEAFNASGALASSAFTLADGSGTFSVDNLAAGDYRVQATWSANGIASAVSLDGVAMGSFGIDFVLSLSYVLSTLTGTLQVFNGAGGVAAAGAGAGPVSFAGYSAQSFTTAKVELFQGGVLVNTVSVDPTGRWTIPNLLPGKYAVRAYNGLEYTGLQQVTLGEGEVQNVGFVFSPLPEKTVFAFPNPARNSVTFRFESGLWPLEAQISVFDLAGALVREIPGSEVASPAPGLYHAAWNLTNSKGEAVASGVYLFMVKVRGGADNQSGKVVKKLAVVR